MLSFHSFECPNLECIQVDDAQYSDSTWVGTVFNGTNFIFDPNPHFSENCAELSVKHHTEHNFSIYPNPALGFISISGIEDIFDVSIYNSVGQLLYQKNDVSSSENIDVSPYKNGILLIRIDLNGSIVYRKVLKG